MHMHRIHAVLRDFIADFVSYCSNQVFVHVESHEMVDVDDRKTPTRLFADGESEQEYQQTVWDGKNNESEKSMV